MVEAIATETALALENVRLLEETHRRANQERLVSNLARQVRSTTDIDSILRFTVSELGQALNASSAVIRLDVSDRDTASLSPGKSESPLDFSVEKDKQP